jgi:hypothetical protein
MLSNRSSRKSNSRNVSSERAMICCPQLRKLTREGPISRNLAADIRLINLRQPYRATLLARAAAAFCHALVRRTIRHLRSVSFNRASGAAHLFRRAFAYAASAINLIRRRGRRPGTTRNPRQRAAESVLDTLPRYMSRSPSSKDCRHWKAGVKAGLASLTLRGRLAQPDFTGGVGACVRGILRSSES